jgi:hypothetical protein
MKSDAEKSLLNRKGRFFYLPFDTIGNSSDPLTPAIVGGKIVFKLKRDD